MRPVHRRLLLLLAVEIAGCADPRTADGIGADGGERDQLPPHPPLAPELPRAHHCPPGWHVIEVGPGAQRCAPYAGERLDCPAGEAHFPGTDGCERIGAACPTGPFPSDLGPWIDREPVAFVSPDAVSGDGSRAQPFGSVAEAFDAGAATIVLARGDYGVIELPIDVALVGACPEGTVIGTAKLEAPARLANLTVASVIATAPTMLDSVVVAQTVTLSESTLTAERSLFTETAAGISGTAELRIATGVVERGGSWDVYGPGATVTLDGVAFSGAGLVPCIRLFNGRLRARDTVISSCRETGITIVDDTAVELVNTTIQGIAVSDLGQPTRGVGSGIADDTFGALPSLVADGLAVLDVEGIGIHVDVGTAILRDVIVANTTPAATTPGEGLGIAIAGAADISRALVTRTVLGGVLAASGASLDLADVTIRDVDPRRGEYGYGLIAQGAETRLAASRIALSDTHEFGLLVDSAHVSLSDLSVREVLPSQSPTIRIYGGVGVQRGASAVLRRAAIASTSTGGLMVHSGSLEATDVSVAGVAARPCGAGCMELGVGAGAYARAALRLERVRITDFDLCGFHLAGGPEVRIVTGEVRGGPTGVCFADAEPDLGGLVESLRIAGVELSSSGTQISPPMAIESLPEF